MSDSKPTHDSQETAEQLLFLQHKLTFLQKSFDELNEVVLLQQKEIEQLKKGATALRELLQSVAEQGWGGDLPDEKPPHY